MSTALIVTDVQLDFCEGGSLAVAGGNVVAERIAALLSGEHGYQFVVATRDHHIDPGSHFSAEPDFIDQWPAHCVVGTRGAEIHPALAGFAFDAVFDKGEHAAAYSGFEGQFQGEALSDWLAEREVHRVDVVGIATDYCVKATALDAVRHGLDTTVNLDLTAAVAPERIGSSIKELGLAGARVVGELPLA